jgi:hypothetical protein
MAAAALLLLGPGRVLLWTEACGCRRGSLSALAEHDRLQ